MSKPLKYKLFFIAWILFCVFLVEVGYSTIYRYGIIAPPPSIFIQEETEETILFDAVRGYRITSKPARLARITNGTLEFLGTFKGNNQGFPDKEDFFPERKDQDTIRIAVFGDSFTAAQYLDTSWPDQVEELLDAEGKKVELLNFSVDGAGLANWWSILLRHVKTDGYQLDGVIFGVFEEPKFGDLYRGFTASDHRESIAHSFRFKDWNPETWPSTYQEAKPHFDELPIHILSHKRFEATLKGEWHPELPRPWRFYASQKITSFFNGKDNTPKLPSPQFEFGDGPRKLTREISAYCDENQLDKIVVRIPLRKSVLENTPIMNDIEEFRSLLDAPLIDGAVAFTGMEKEEVLEHYFPYDGHWNQKGSDRFAELMKSNIVKIYFE